MNSSSAITWRRIPERYNLIGTHCSNCNTSFFPSRNICPNCRRKGRMGVRKFSGRGKIYSYTRVTAPPTGFELEAPYFVAIVELEEGPRVLAQLVDCGPGDVAIGKPVRMVFRRIQEDGKDGLIHYGFKFRLA